MRKPFHLGGETIQAGSRRWVQIPIPSAMGLDASHLEVFVIHGREDGPRLFISAAIHGDELNGIEIIRRLIRRRSMRSLRGTLIAVPVVNIYGLANRSRYLPDGRDLNRSFPGSEKGSLASRMARIFIQEIVAKCSHGIDLHTGGRHRENMPQIRGNFDNESLLELGNAFGVPVMLQSNLRNGSIRAAARKFKIPTIVYEGGEALRYDELPIRAGLRGVLQVMGALNMINPVKPKKQIKSVLADRSSWVRAPSSGLMRTVVSLGESVAVGDTLAIINNPGTLEETEVISEYDGIVIGRTTIPTVNEGDATLNIAIFSNSARANKVAERVEAYEHQITSNEEYAPPQQSM